MKFSKEVQNKILELVSESRTNEAFDMLIGYGVRDAITMKANFTAAKRAHDLGKVSYNEYSQKLSQAHAGIMSFIGVEAPDMDGITVYKNAEKAKPQNEEDVLRNGVLYNAEFIIAYYGKALRLTHPKLVETLYDEYMKIMKAKADCAFGFKTASEPVLDEELLALIIVADNELSALKNDWKENVKQLIISKSFPTPENIAKALETCQANGLLTQVKFNAELSGWAIQAQILQQITAAIQ